ncbi:MAG: hypothetical protein IAA97_04945 [Spirochaetes bacterium]|uniref:Tetratricopeptide repeat protein n=1 Tax=Candidatus Ornithospirochaeta stercoripullorum TaxID=2840899 RepID=A0A9D9E086_9SPIO|nr:hypothetical protein [Candidatus Ornithospirochaeta stercoripullorum]
MDIEKNTKNKGVEDKLNSFMSKHAKPIIAIFVVVIVLLIAACIAVVTIQNSKNAAFDAVADLESQFTAMNSMDPESAEYSEALAAFQADADALAADGTSEYPGAKATMLLGDLAFQDMDWQSAADYYAAVAEGQSGTYLAQLALMNEAACYENLDQSDIALGLYNEVLDTYGDKGVFAPKAMFSVGRIYAEQGEAALAEAEFQNLTGLYLVPGNGAMPSEYARMAEAYLINY